MGEQNVLGITGGVCVNNAAGHLPEGNISTLTYLEQESLPDQRKGIHLGGSHGQK